MPAVLRSPLSTRSCRGSAVVGGRRSVALAFQMAPWSKPLSCTCLASEREEVPFFGVDERVALRERFSSCASRDGDNETATYRSWSCGCRVGASVRVLWHSIANNEAARIVLGVRNG